MIVLYDAKGGGGGGEDEEFVIVTLIFSQIVWMWPLTTLVSYHPANSLYLYGQGFAESLQQKLSQTISTVVSRAMAAQTTLTTLVHILCTS